MRRLIRIAVTIAGMLTMQAAVAEEINEAARFGLWNECKPIALVTRIQYVNEEEIEMSLSPEDIEIAARDKLRVNGLYSKRSEGNGVLLVDVVTKLKAIGGIRGSLSIELLFYKRVLDMATKIERRAVTYKLSFPFGFHVHESDIASVAAPIIQTVSIQTDSFINLYRRVNADACKNSN